MAVPLYSPVEYYAPFRTRNYALTSIKHFGVSQGLVLDVIKTLDIQSGTMPPAEMVRVNLVCSETATL